MLAKHFEERERVEKVLLQHINAGREGIFQGATIWIEPPPLRPRAQQTEQPTKWQTLLTWMFYLTCQATAQLEH